VKFRIKFKGNKPVPASRGLNPRAGYNAAAEFAVSYPGGMCTVWFIDEIFDIKDREGKKVPPKLLKRAVVEAERKMYEKEKPRKTVTVEVK
jgi:hypothetical protein